MVYQEAKALVDAYIAVESESRRNIGIMADDFGHQAQATIENSGRPCLLDSETRSAFNDLVGMPQVHTREFAEIDSHVIEGVEYWSATKRQNGCFVVYKTGDRRMEDHGTEVSGKIVQIFRHPMIQDTTYFALKRFKAAVLPIGVSDPYKRLDVGFLASTELEDGIIVMSTPHIVCQFVKTTVSLAGVELMHVLPYSRVSHYLTYPWCSLCLNPSYLGSSAVP